MFSTAVQVDSSGQLSKSRVYSLMETSVILFLFKDSQVLCYKKFVKNSIKKSYKHNITDYNITL